MPELPEMQALAERLDAVLSGRVLRRADLLGFSSLKTYAPSPADLKGATLTAVTRRAKYLVWRFDDGNRIVLHLSQAGRLDIETPPKKTKPRGAVARFVFGEGTGGLDGEGIGILVREYGTQRKASWWVLGPDDEGPLADLGPEPGSDEFAEFIRTSNSKRHLTTDLRDQHTVSGIGRGWGDDILQRAKLSPFASLGSLKPEQREALLGRGGRGARGSARARAPATRRPLRVEPRRPLQSARALRRALPDVRHQARAGLVRILRDGVLPDLPDRRQGSGRPPPVPLAQVSPTARRNSPRSVGAPR